MAYFDKYGVEFSDDKKTLVRCPVDFDGKYVIPNGVKIIGNAAFSYCRGLTNIEIPNSIMAIEKFAFEFCKSLTSVVLPNSVMHIGDYAFKWCESLISIVIPNNVTCIGDEVFFCCVNLNSITIPNSISKINIDAFKGCNNLTKIYVPNGEKSRFAHMEGLKEFVDIIREEGCLQVENTDNSNTVHHRSYSAQEIEDMRYYEAEARFIEETIGVDIRDSIA